jgi:endogenous inhibitor of DNA gyrase (YacG/DUF329 family)
MKCPTCKGAVAAPVGPSRRWFPFCCERCQLVDLGRWLGEEFKVSEPLGTADQSPSSPSSEEA